MVNIWRVLVRKEGINERFEDEGKARTYYEKCKEKYKKVVLATTDIKEPEGKGKIGQLWCPYCGEWRKFKDNGIKGIIVCDWCGISDNDFYIKKFNRLWGIDK